MKKDDNYEIYCSEILDRCVNKSQYFSFATQASKHVINFDTTHRFCWLYTISLFNQDTKGLQKKLQISLATSFYFIFWFCQSIKGCLDAKLNSDKTNISSSATHLSF